MAAFLITLIGGAVAGAFTARQILRHEIKALRESLQEQAKPPVAVPPQPAALVPPRPRHRPLLS